MSSPSRRWRPRSGEAIAEARRVRIVTTAFFDAVVVLLAVALAIAVLIVVVILIIYTIAVLDYPFNGDLRVGPGAFELVLGRIG